jgi:hypothetical protein
MLPGFEPGPLSGVDGYIRCLNPVLVYHIRPTLSQHRLFLLGRPVSEETAPAFAAEHTPLSTLISQPPLP